MSELGIRRPSDSEEFERFDEQATLLAQPVSEVPRSFQEDTALQSDLAQFDEFRRKGEAGIRASNIILR